MRIRRDPVTVIGDETHGSHWPGKSRAGKAWGVGRSESQETDPGERAEHAGSRGRARAIARHWSHFILGGARSGKSRYAAALATSARADQIAFVATAEPLDGDMRSRIARHRAERPADWLTVEEPLDLVGACRRLPSGVDLAIVDCVNLWVANRVLRGELEPAIVAGAEELAALVSERIRSWIIVSNEVGEGVHPPTEVGRRFRDVLGLVNQRIAAAACDVTLMVAGIPLRVKERPPRLAGVAPGAGPDRAHEAP